MPGVKLAKTGHGPHSYKLVVICVVLLLCVILCIVCGAWGGVVVKALRYWSEGPGIDPRSLGIFSGASHNSRIFLGVKTA